MAAHGSVCIIAAINRHLDGEVAAGKFRMDAYPITSALISSMNFWIAFLSIL